MEEEGATLAGLPFVRWARRFCEGTVRLEGLAHQVEFDGLTVDGPVELVFTFRGGGEPQVNEVALSGTLTCGALVGTALIAGPEEAHLDEQVLPDSFRRDLLVETVVRHLHDVRAWAEVVPDGEVVVKFQHGVQAVLSPDAVVSVRGCTQGSPDALRLTEALVMEVDGEGVRLSHQRFQRLASFARLRIEGAALHPDGEVRLKGGANATLDRLVHSGLDRASARLSDLVRRSPKFARVRRFLRAKRA